MEAVGKFLGTLMQSRNQAHIYHLQVTGPGSFAAHKALDDYYNGIIPLIDGIAESIQGRHGIIRGYKMDGTIKEDGNFVSYFDALSKFVETARTQCPQDSYVQNQIDTVVELVESTRYKLKNLQ